jgi:large subunit ribosomal protein L10
MNREQKAAVVDEIAGQLAASDAIFAVDYRGISVTQVAVLRGKLREVDASFRVVKNSLSELAADKAGVEQLKPMLQGPTALTFVRGDAAMAAKALSDTARQLRLLEFKGGLMNGNALSAADVQSIARLPSREVLYAQLVGTVAAPLTGLARTLNALIGGLAIQLQAIADQGLVGGAAGSTSAPTAGEAEAEVQDEATRVGADADTAAPDEPRGEPEQAPQAEEEPGPEAAAAPEAAAEPEPEPEPESTDTDPAADAE